jgi:hypothetical protein
MRYMNVLIIKNPRRESIGWGKGEVEERGSQPPRSKTEAKYLGDLEYIWNKLAFALFISGGW